MLPRKAVGEVLAEHRKRAARDARDLEQKLRELAAQAPAPANVSPPKRKKKKPKPPPVSEPIDASLLCVDAAGTSGFAMWDRGRLCEFGEVDVFGDGVRHVLAQFLERLPGPHILVIERPFVARWSTATSRPVGERIWIEAAKRLGFGGRIVRVYPSQWRAVALGKGWGSRKRDETRTRERELAGAWVVEHLGPRAPELGPDAAAAVMIGRWATFAGEVSAVLPKRRRVSKRAQLELETLNRRAG